MANLISGLFETESAAENAVSQLKSMGYSSNEITVIMKDRNAARDFADETGTRTMADVGTGAAIGGTIGAVLAGLLAVGSVTIPGVGLVAAGPLAAMLAGAGAGGAAGSLVGWLVGAGVSEDVAPYYERGLNDGGIVVTCAAHPGDEARVQNILQGGSVAYSGYNTPSYVAPTYRERYQDLGNGVPGVQTGGRTVDGAPDTRGIMEKTADTLTGDRIDDKTGKVVAKNPIVDAGREPIIDNGIPGVQTGGHAVDGTPDTRGMMEKTADAVTGDRIDDKTGKVVR